MICVDRLNSGPPNKSIRNSSFLWNFHKPKDKMQISQDKDLNALHLQLLYEPYIN
jgi:hypothetical protein